MTCTPPDGLQERRSARPRIDRGERGWRREAICCLAVLLVTLSSALPLSSQVETIPGSEQLPLWVSLATLEGYLETSAAPAAPFSADSRTLAVCGQGKIVLFNLVRQDIQRVLKPQVEDVRNLTILSAPFVDDTTLLVRAIGQMPRGEGSKQSVRTPEMLFLWNTIRDGLEGTVKALVDKPNSGKGFYFPQLRYLIRYSGEAFDIWAPVQNRGMKLEIASLTRRPELFGVSPDGHWMLVARLAGSAQSDVVVIRLKEKEMVAALRGHEGMPRSISFSPDGSQVATAGDGQVIRIWDTADWVPKKVLEGHTAPVNWVEFSPDGRTLVSAAEDATVKVWSSQTGEHLQTLSDHKLAVVTAAFSKNGLFLATSSQKTVKVYKRVGR